MATAVGGGIGYEPYYLDEKKRGVVDARFRVKLLDINLILIDLYTEETPAHYVLMQRATNSPNTKPFDVVPKAESARVYGLLESKTDELAQTEFRSRESRKSSSPS